MQSEDFSLCLIFQRWRLGLVLRCKLGLGLSYLCNGYV